MTQSRSKKLPNVSSEILENPRESFLENLRLQIQENPAAAGAGAVVR